MFEDRYLCSTIELDFDSWYETLLDPFIYFFGKCDLF